MSSEQQNRNKGRLFENAEKKKPSQPDMRGDCTLDGAPYEIQAWQREEQLTLTVAPPREGNTYPPEAFRGALEPAPSGRGAAKESGEAPLWVGSIAGNEGSYSVQAFKKQGKSGSYLTLTFEPVAAA